MTEVPVLQLGSVQLPDWHDDTWQAAARTSSERLQDVEPDVVHLSHDPTVLRRTR